MPNVFQGIGRSGALREGTSDILNVVMGLRQLQSQEATQALQREEAGLNISLAKMGLREKQAEIDRLDKPIRAKDFFRNMTPGGSDFLMKFGVENDLIHDRGGELFTSEREILQGQKLLEHRVDILGSVMDVEIQGLGAALDEKDQAILKATKPEQRQALMGERQALAERQAGMVKHRNLLDPEIRRALATRTLEPPELPYQIGEEIERKEGSQIITYQVKGYGADGLPILERVAGAARFESEDTLPKVPDQVVKAQDFVKAIAGKLSLDPLLAIGFKDNPEMLALLQTKLPATTMTAFEKASKIVNDYYQSISEEPATRTRKSGLAPSHESTIPPGTEFETIDPLGIFGEGF